jgi:polar amino acid transport system substrate-binding protein
MYKKIFWFILIFAMIAVLYCGNDYERDEVRVGFDVDVSKNPEPKRNEVILTTGEWPPYTSENLDAYGFFTEIVTTTFQNIRFESVIDFYPWKRCEELVKSGEAFAAFPYSLNEERSKHFNFSDPVMEGYTRFYYYDKPEGFFNYEELSELKDYTIGVVGGYFYIEMLINAGLEDSLDYCDKEISAIRKLVEGRVDLVPLNTVNGWELIKKEFPDEEEKFDTLEKELIQTDLRLLVSKRYTDASNILNRFNRGLEIIKNNGTYNEILKKHDIKASSVE